MNTSIEFLLNTASAAQIAEHLRSCDSDFLPPLHDRVEIRDYAQKIVSKATRFEAWSDSKLIGLVATYCNDQMQHIAYLTSVSVLRTWTSQGIAAYLVNQCIEHTKTIGMRLITLEVAEQNRPAIKLYQKYGFIISRTNEPFLRMDLYFKRGEEHEQ